MERFGPRSLRDDNRSGKETKFLVLDSSSIRVFFRNRVKKKCIENEMDPQAHKLLDMTFTKSIRSDEVNQNTRKVRILGNSSMERFGHRSLRDDNRRGKETKFLVLGSSSIRVFFRNKVKKKCIENEMCPQTYKLLDTTSTKSTRSDEVNQNVQRIRILGNSGMERFGFRSLRDDKRRGKETRFLVLDSSSIRVFFRNKVKKKCIENEMDPQAHKLLDTTFTKSTRSDGVI
jgi:hypothetical protein